MDQISRLTRAALTFALIVLACGVARAQEVVWVGATNVGDCKSGSASSSMTNATGLLLNDVMKAHPDAIVFGGGDNQYDSGTEAEYEACYNQTGWGTHRKRTLPVIGDHDKDVDYYFSNFAADSSYLLHGPSQQAKQTYFSYEVGSWHVIGLNSESISDAQMEWLEQDLAASKADCTIAYWHRPRFSTGKNGSSTKMAGLWDVLYDNGVDVVIQGHDHSYQRFEPLDKEGGADPVYGIRTWVLGTGGTGLTSITDHPQIAVQDNQTHGIAKFVLGKGTYSWEFIPVAGKTFTDSGKASCHGIPGSGDGLDTGSDPGDDPGQDPGDDPGQDPGDDPGQDPGPGAGVSPETDKGSGDGVEGSNCSLGRSGTSLSLLAMLTFLVGLYIKRRYWRRMRGPGPGGSG